MMLDRCSVAGNFWVDVFGRLNVETAEGLERYRLIAPPPPLAADLRSVLRVGGLRCRPAVFVVPSTPRIAFASPGVVVLGEESIEELAELTWQEHTVPAPFATPSATLVTKEQVLAATWRYSLAHELGHVQQFERQWSCRPLQMERGADVFAGKVFRRLGWDARLGAAVAETVGCEHVRCAHQYRDPQGRRQDFLTGYRSAHAPNCAAW